MYIYIYVRSILCTYTHSCACIDSSIYIQSALLDDKKNAHLLAQKNCNEPSCHVQILRTTPPTRRTSRSGRPTYLMSSRNLEICGGETRLSVVTSCLWVSWHYQGLAKQFINLPFGGTLNTNLWWFSGWLILGFKPHDLLLVSWTMRQVLFEFSPESWDLNSAGRVWTTQLRHVDSPGPALSVKIHHPNLVWIYCTQLLRSITTEVKKTVGDI